MSMRPNERLLVGKDPNHAARLAADAVVATLSGCADHPSVALAGGSTPALLYATLAKPPYRECVPWDRVNWFWADERAVPPEHHDSNYRMAMEAMLRPVGVNARLIHRMVAEGGRDARPPESAADEYVQTIQRLLPANASGVPVFDLILLGIGPDGHTASLFPGTAALGETQQLVVANFVPAQNAWRMTMTYPLLMAAHEILFFITGPGKAEIMPRLLGDPPEELPAAALRNVSGRVTWVLDADAARLVAPSGAE